MYLNIKKSIIIKIFFKNFIILYEIKYHIKYDESNNSLRDRVAEIKERINEINKLSS